MSKTRSSAKPPKPATAANTGVRRRSLRFSQSKTKPFDERPAGLPGVRKNANKTSTRVSIATPTCPPRRSQRLLQIIPSGCGENAQKTPEIITTTVLRRSQRLLQSKTDSSKSFFFGSGENAQNAPGTITTTVLRRSQRLLKQKTDIFKSRFFDGSTRQVSDLFKKSSVRSVRKSILPVSIEAVRLNFDDVETVECNDAIGNERGSSERRITRGLSASVASQNGHRKSGSRTANTNVEVGQQRGSVSLSSLAVDIGKVIEKDDNARKSGLRELERKSGSRTADTNVEAGQQSDSIPLSSLAVDIGKIIEKDDDARKSRLRELEGIFSESDSPHVSKLEKRCIRRTSKGKKQVGTKRKQKKSDDAIQGTGSGWTKEQENALQRAYFAAKPTPNFWKRVARLVPGKSSQECFDKVNSKNLTPPTSQPRSRCKPKALSPLLEVSFSDSDLLSQPNGKRKTRRKKYISKKAVRNLMRKNSHMEPDNKADFFSVLEPTVNLLPEALPSIPVFSTPTASAEKGSSSSCRSHFLSSQKKSKSRFSRNSEIPIASPPVLKPIRNIALHDKYVDQLHAREAKRKTAATARNKRSTFPKGDVVQPVLKKIDVVRAAKESLLSDAKHVISKFRHSQMHIENENDSEEDIIDEEEDDDDDAL